MKVNFVSEQYDFFLNKMSMQTFSTMLGFCEVMQIQVSHPQVSENLISKYELDLSCNVSLFC